MNDRIPPRIKKLANKLGPGKYRDPETGRIYVDSADMDDAFEKMIDETASSDRKRIEEYEAARKMPKPPENIRRMAERHVHNHAMKLLQKVEDSEEHGWRKRAKKRRRFLLAKRAFKRTLASDLDAEETQELADLEAALNPKKENETDGK